MAHLRNAVTTVAAVLAMTLAAAPGMTHPAKLDGVIMSVRPGRVLVRTEAGEQTVVVPPSTRIESISGAFNASRARKPATALISGLPIKVEGNLDANVFTANRIEYKAKDYQTAVQIQAGVHDTAKSNREVRSAVSKTGQFDVKAETHVFFTVGSAVISQISAGRKNMLALEIDGANEAMAFNQEGPEELWVGRRENATVIKRDPGALSAPAARMATLPAGHPQGYHDCFDAFVADAYATAQTGEAPDGMPTFRDGLRAARITAAVLSSARTETWVDVPDAAALTAGSVDG